MHSSSSIDGSNYKATHRETTQNITHSPNLILPSNSTYILNEKLHKGTESMKRPKEASIHEVTTSTVINNSPV